MWTSIFLMIASAVIQAALAPKPQAPKAASLGDFDLPTAEEGKPIKVIFGTVVIEDPNCVYYGNLGKKAIKSKKGKK
jgi:hypothetical protein